MAVTIKLKNASGSDPSASDLVVGELAIRTDSGKLFTKKDNGSVAEISGGGAGLDDGDKGDITVSNGGDTFTIDSGVVTSAKIANDTIVNADINSSAAIALSKLATGTLPSGLKINHNNLQTGIIENENVSSSAAIAGSKISPNFGSQNVQTSGYIQIQNTNPTLHFTDTDNDDDFSIMNRNGLFVVRDETDGADRFTIGSDGTTDITGNLDVGAGLDVTGATTLLGDGNASVAWGDTSALGHLSFTATDGNPIVRALTGKALVFQVNQSTTAMTLDSNGNTSVNALTINSTTPVLSFQESDGNPDYRQYVEGGAFHIEDITNSNAVRLKINTDGHIDITAGLDITSGGLDVTGNITVSGTVDGRDLATDGTKLDGIESNATADQTVTEIKSLIAGSPLGATHIATDAIGSAELAANAVTSAHIAANTITAGDIATDAVGSAEIAADAVTGDHIANDSIDSEHYVDGSIDTAFIANDAVTYAKIQNVSATNRILGRDSSGAGVIEEITPANLRTMINVENGATADQTAAEIRTLVGNASDSNVFTDALLSKLNGIAASATNVTNNNQLTNGAGYITATLTNEQVQDIVGGMVSSNTESGITVTYQDSDGTLDFSVASQTDNNFTNADHSKLDGIESGATADQTASEIRTLVGNASDSNVFTDALLSKLNGIASSATNVTNNNQLTNGAGYITTATVAGGAVYENTQTISSDYTVGNNKNAMSAGPISIADGVTVTIGDGETYTII